MPEHCLEWRPVIGYEEYYLVSEDGQIKTRERACNIHHNSKMIRRPKFLRVYEHPSGYNVVTLYKNRKRTLCGVHRLVAMAFVENAENKPQVNHKDGDRRNNHYSNLEWVTNYENQQHAIFNGLVRYVKGDEHGCSKTNSNDVKKMRELYKTGKYSWRELGTMFGLTKSHVGQIIRRLTWRHV